MSDKFSRINLNGEVKFVSAIFDGSGNEIEATYETKTNVSSKASELNTLITTNSTDITSLKDRMTAVETYQQTTGAKHTEDIAVNAENITTLSGNLTSTASSLDALTIRVGSAENNIQTLLADVQQLKTDKASLQSSLGTLEAIVNNEEMGVNALNTQADQNTADIAQVQQSLNTLVTSVDSKVSLEVFNALLARVESLEQALAANHPDAIPNE